jgi:hypothetical protein
MALKFIGQLDLFTYFDTLSDDMPVNSTDVNEGIQPGTLTSAQNNHKVAYHDASDRILMQVLARVDTRASPGNFTNDNVILACDPVFFDAGNAVLPAWQAEPGTVDGFGTYVGTLNPSSGQQKIYQQLSGVLAEVNPVDLNEALVADPFPNFDLDISVITIGNPGYSTTRRGGILFEGMTDGITGSAQSSGFEGTLLTGSNVYPSGLALMKHTAGNLHAAGDFDNSIGWHDLDTGNLVGGVGVPGRATTSQTEPFDEPRIEGENVAWDHWQYIPDNDATFAIPKGRLFCFDQIPDTVGSADNDRLWLRLIEFNPLGVAATAGNPERTHARILMTSKINFNESPIISGGQSFANSGKHIIFHPPLERVIIILSERAFAGGNNTLPLAGYAVANFYSIQPEINDLYPIRRHRVPRTADVGLYSSKIIGSSNEPVGGAEASWTLQRISTEAEVIDATTFPGSSTVANFPIDPHVDGRTEGSLVVYSDGTPLVETTDYTVVLATGVITWVTDQSGATAVTVDYEHRQTPADPPYGTLENATSTSDNSGDIFTRVAYDDDNTIVGELDELIASVDTDQ